MGTANLERVSKINIMFAISEEYAHTFSIFMKTQNSQQFVILMLPNFCRLAYTRNELTI